MLATLFQNLQEYIIDSNSLATADNSVLSQGIIELKELEKTSILVSFQENLAFDTILNFAVTKTPKVGQKITQKGGRVITCDPAKTYPCGAVCRSQSKDCNNPIEGQAKTYVEFLKLQGKKEGKIKGDEKKPIDTEKKETEAIVGEATKTKKTKSATSKAVLTTKRTDKLTKSEVVAKKTKKEIEQDEKDEILNVISKLDIEGKFDNLIPIAKIREALADKYTVKKIDKILSNIPTVRLQPKPSDSAIDEKDTLDVGFGIKFSHVSVDKSLAEFIALMEKDKELFKDRLASLNAELVDYSTLASPEKLKRKRLESKKPNINYDGIIREKVADESFNDAQKNLKATKERLRKRVVSSIGSELVEKAERNVKRILNDPETDIFIRIPSNQVLELIADGGFRNAHQIGTRPGMKSDSGADDYLRTRESVEDTTLGYPRNIDPNDRPIYGYLGTNNISGVEHDDVGASYGAIAVKLKKETKARASFTGADSFKSGYSSKLKTYEGDPDNKTTPPPDISSMIPWTYFNKSSTMSESDIDEKIKEVATSVTAARTIHDLAKASAPSGFSYVETQIYGGTSFDDVDSIYLPNDKNHFPSEKLLNITKTKGIKVFVGGKLIKYNDE